MTFEGMLSKMGTGAKQFTDRYAEYGAPPAQDPHLLYTYEPQPPGHPEASSKYTHSSGGHKSNAAMSALTLLAFLFFLHILQQCIKEHMTAMNTPQITIMTAGREGETTINKADAKHDKSGLTQENDSGDQDGTNPNENVNNENDDKYLEKINTAEPPRFYPNYKDVLKNYGDRRFAQPEFVSAMDEQ